MCSTFELAKALEWASWLFVLGAKEEDEEDIDNCLIISHKQPEFPGDQITVTATVQEINRHELVCSVVATLGAKIIADGETRHKILKKEKLAKLLNPKRA